MKGVVLPLQVFFARRRMGFRIPHKERNCHIAAYMLY